MHNPVEPLPPHYRRNFSAMLAEFVLFDVSINFVHFSSVVPAFVRQLTSSAPLVGLATTLFAGGFQYPQVLFAHLTRSHARKRPAMMWGTIGRIFLWIFAIALWAGLGRRPTAMLALFLVGITIFAFSDGLVTLLWFDVMARAIPANRRGRLFGLSQVISGVTGIGVGALVGLILATPYQRPLASYAMLFTLSGAAMLLSTIALALIVEPPAEVLQPEQQTRAGFVGTVLRDPAFRRLLVCRLLLSGVDMATPFYVGHAQDQLYMPASAIGGFVMAQTIGMIVGSVLWGAVSERWHSRAVIRITSALTPLVPLFALLLHRGTGDWPALLYPLVFAVLGITGSAWILGFQNYSMDIAPEGWRPAYLGLMNTLFGLTVLTPTLGGWVLQASSYPVLFGSAAAVGSLGVLAALWLRPARPTGSGQSQTPEPAGAPG